MTFTFIPTQIESCIEMNKLNPCPFCGGEVKLEQTGSSQITIKCKSCPAKMTQKTLRHTLEWLESEMIKDWNKRPYADAPGAKLEIEKLRKDLQGAYRVLENLEYIGADFAGNEIINQLTPEYYSKWKFCPSCGYKQPDGHWKDCELSEWLDSMSEEPE
jgi:hypothetical protein